MPRPTTKTQLLAESQKTYEALEQFIANLPPDRLEQPGAIGTWSVKDVVAHLLEWQRMVLSWQACGQRGETPALPAPGYKWSETLALNQMIFEKYHDQPLGQVLSEFRASHPTVMALITSLSEEDLFSPGRFAWTKKNNFATYLISCTSSHYHWARTEMRKSLKG